MTYSLDEVQFERPESYGIMTKFLLASRAIGSAALSALTESRRKKIYDDENGSDLNDVTIDDICNMKITKLREYARRIGIGRASTYRREQIDELRNEVISCMGGE